MRIIVLAFGPWSARICVVALQFCVRVLNLSEINERVSEMKTAARVKSDIVAKAVSDEEFRSRLLTDPHSAASEIAGMEIPSGLSVRVHEENASTYHVVLPPGRQLSEHDLERVSGGGWGKGW